LDPTVGYKEDRMTEFHDPTPAIRAHMERQRRVVLDAPLDQFAERLIRSGEIGKFIEGLIGMTDYEFIKKIVDQAMAKHAPPPPPPDPMERSFHYY
jgi:hypothetical protein